MFLKGTMIDRKLPLVFQMHSVNVDGPLLRRHHHLCLDHLIVGKRLCGQPAAPADGDSFILCKRHKIINEPTWAKNPLLPYHYHFANAGRFVWKEWNECMHFILGWYLELHTSCPLESDWRESTNKVPSGRCVSSAVREDFPLKWSRK